LVLLLWVCLRFGFKNGILRILRGKIRRNKLKKTFTVLTLFAVCAAAVFAEGTASAGAAIPVTIEIAGIEPGKGMVFVAVASNRKDYEADKSYTAFILESESATMYHQVDLPAGEYVVSGFQDTNGNYELDTGMFGIPKEPFDKTRYTGGVPGTFDELKVPVNAANTTIRIKLARGINKRTPSNTSLLIRPNAAAGFLSAKDIKAWAFDFGGKILLSANKEQRYGLLVDYMMVPANEQLAYLRAGIYIEQVLWSHFNMAIGTIGNINLAQPGDNPFGLYSHLGFEYAFENGLSILIAYQSDWIFREAVTSYNALHIGLGFTIG
jgi:uncharacterized protein (DUF2141 family)